MTLTPAQVKALRGLVAEDADHVTIGRAFGGGITVLRARKAWVIDVNGRTTRIEEVA